MAETSNIAWTKSTFNGWIGCTKIGPGCDHCYAEVQDSRKRWGKTTHWGAGVPRHRTSESYWKQPLAWDKLAANEKWRAEHGEITTPFADRPGFWPVFCASLADVFDNEVPDEWRKDLFDLIEQTPNLSWLLVTKRIGNVPAMAYRWLLKQEWPKNCRLMITVVNQEEADRDIPKLLALNCKNGISYEPALGPIDFTPDFGNYDAWDYLRGQQQYGEAGDAAGVGGGVVVRDTQRIEWVIIGGESAQGGQPARPFNIEWARSTIAQCKAAGVPVFMKQMGSHVIWNGCAGPDEQWPDGTYRADVGRGHWIMGLKDRSGADPDEWPEDLRVREFPDA